MRERRILHEWGLLEQLARANPERLDALRHGGEDFHLTLRATPTLVCQPDLGEDWTTSLRTVHSVRISFPRYFPSMPSEVYVADGVFHPNAHPDTGFVCIWARHLARYTVEHTLAQLCRVLTGHLFNADERHVMQPDALTWYLGPAARARLPLSSAPLTVSVIEGPDERVLRRRLS